MGAARRPMDPVTAAGGDKEGQMTYPRIVGAPVGELLAVAGLLGSLERTADTCLQGQAPGFRCHLHCLGNEIPSALKKDGPPGLFVMTREGDEIVPGGPRGALECRGIHSLWKGHHEVEVHIDAAWSTNAA